VPITARVRTLLFCLTLVAGYADAVAFFSLGVFTANMTGNTVLLGGAIVGQFVGLRGSIGLVLPALSLVAFVCAGWIAARFLRGEQRRPPRRSRLVLSGLALTLAATAALQRWGEAPALSVALLSAVMGAQSIVAVRAGVAGMSTTFVTGTLVRSIMTLAGSSAHTAVLADEGRTNAAVWVCYLVGAVLGATALKLLGHDALWLPAAAVALSLVVV
jgi:uncharacterized membrane protein YoaK (UPF0700 family)